MEDKKEIISLFCGSQHRQLLPWQEIRTPPVNQIKDLERVPGNLVADAIIFTQFAEFTLTIEDAQEYVYSISPTKRVRGWRDIEVKLYI